LLHLSEVVTSLPSLVPQEDAGLLFNTNLDGQTQLSVLRSSAWTTHVDITGGDTVETVVLDPEDDDLQQRLADLGYDINANWLEEPLSYLERGTLEEQPINEEFVKNFKSKMRTLLERRKWDATWREDHDPSEIFISIMGMVSLPPRHRCIHRIH
jgi:hypothetical protein